MDNHAYELGVKVAMVDVGLMEKEALNPFVRNALIGAGVGGAGGAAMANDKHRLEAGLAGALGGAGLGALGTAAGKGVGKLRGALKASREAGRKKKLIAEGDKLLAQFEKKHGLQSAGKARPIGNAEAAGKKLVERTSTKAQAGAGTAAKKTSNNLAAEGGGYGGGFHNINDPSYNMAQQLSGSVPMGQSSAGAQNTLNSLMW